MKTTTITYDYTSFPDKTRATYFGPPKTYVTFTRDDDRVSGILYVGHTGSQQGLRLAMVSKEDLEEIYEILGEVLREWE